MWRDQLEFNESANKLETALQPFLIREEYTDEWPGTKLLRSKAKVRHYRLTDESLPILAEAPSLYAWLAPNLPEDLAFYATDGRCWLLSSAHEKDSAFVDDSVSIKELQASVPGLDLKS